MPEDTSELHVQKVHKAEPAVDECLTGNAGEVDAEEGNNRTGTLHFCYFTGFL
jgi:hypothetical protein